MSLSSKGVRYVWPHTEPANSTEGALPTHLSHPSPPRCGCSVLPLVSKVTRSLRFNPQLTALADRIVHSITEGGRRPFNGLHLRFEEDGIIFHRAFGGGTQVGWGEGFLEFL